MLEIESRQNARFDRIQDSLTSTANEMKEMREIINTKEETILKELRDRDASTNARIDELQSSVASGSRAAKLTEIYMEHRKSLRLWPIKGQNGKGAELRLSLFSFLKEHLKITGDDLCRLGNISIKKFRDPANKNSDEVLVVFETREARDYVKAAAKHLGGNTSVGMKIHVPTHLEHNFKILQSLGYHLRQSDEGIRRSIKFDDENEDLAMDIRVDDKWSRIRPAEAKEVCQANPDFYSGPSALSATNISDILKRKKNTPATGANAAPRQE